MVTAATRPLPGIRFEPRAPALDAALPRMDVAAFVGFAASGPLHVPVAVEDSGQFRAIFGGPAPIAWNPALGRTEHTQLAGAVQAFFDNGGRRCWVVRVAGTAARYDHFPLSGMLMLRGGRAEPAFARARSEGSWADGLRVDTALRVRALAVLASPAEDTLILGGGSPVPEPGAVLRFGFADERRVMFAVVASTEANAIPADPAATRIRLASLVRFDRVAFDSPPQPESTVTVRLFDTVARPPVDAGRIARADDGKHPFERTVQGRLVADDEGMWPSETRDSTLAIELDLPPAEAPVRGAWLQWDTLAGPTWLAVDTLGLGAASTSPPVRTVRITGPAWRQVDLATSPPAAALGSLPDKVEVVTFDLRVHETGGGVTTLDDLGLDPRHPRYWNGLATDDVFHARDPGATDAIDGEPPSVPSARQRRSSQDRTRFALAGAHAPDVMFLPLVSSSTFDTPQPVLRQSSTALERDGLARRAAGEDPVAESLPDLFLDPDLRDVRVDLLMTEADRIRYLAPATRPLRGIHAVLGSDSSAIGDEVTILAMPDATHPGWALGAAPAPPAIPVLSPIPRPAWWPGLACDGSAEIPRTALPPRDQFIPCHLRAVDPPHWLASQRPDAGGTFALSWSHPERDGRYVLEESTRADFADAHPVLTGTSEEITLYSRSAGDYFYRVRIVVGENDSDWSEVVVVHVGDDRRWELVTPEPRPSENRPLLALHRAALRLCAARGDLFAILSLSEQAREAEAIAHAGTLRTLAAADTPPGEVPPLGPSEAATLSYGAIYHPWLIQRTDDGALTTVCPDGAACGVLAKRALSRGAWVAPANEPLRGPIALTPPIPVAARRAVQDAQINLVRQEPRGFLVLAEDTLSLDPDTRPVNVRRLLMLLRRLALRRGATYVFEPMNDAFRRRVQRGFEEVMFELFQQGAFAGTAPASAYQVVTDVSVNPPPALDLGRFVVELKVAPSLPLHFLTLRLINAADRLTIREGR